MIEKWRQNLYEGGSCGALLNGLIVLYMIS